MPTKNPGSLTPFCLATNDDNSAIYGLAYGFNTSQLDLGEHIILLKASTTATPPVTTPSFTSLAWSVIAMVQRFRVTSGYGYGDGNSGTCSVSSSGVFSHVGSFTNEPNSTSYEPYPSGFRYDPSLLPPSQSLPTTLSTFNLSATDPAWVNLTFSSDVAYPWGYYGINYTSPRLFYVSSSLSSLGGENQSTNPTLLLSYQSTVNLTDIIFAQEDGNRKFYYAGTMKIPTTYFGRIITTTSALGRLYAIGYPYANPNATQVVSIPVTKDSIKKFPTAGVKVYSASPTAASACTENQSVTASMVGNNTFYMLCGTPKGSLLEPTNYSLLQVQDLSSNDTYLQVNQTHVTADGFYSFLAFPGVSSDPNQLATPFGVILTGSGLMSLTLGGSRFGTSQSLNPRIAVPWPMDELDPPTVDTESASTLRSYIVMFTIAGVFGFLSVVFCYCILSKHYKFRRQERLEEELAQALGSQNLQDSQKKSLPIVDEGKIELEEEGAEGGIRVTKGGESRQGDLDLSLHHSADVPLQELNAR